MRLQSVFVAIVLLVAVSFGAPNGASACTCLPKTIAQSDPFDGATDVALNQAIVIQGYLDAASIKLEDASGNEVPFALNHGPIDLGCTSTWSELIPKQPLAAVTQYTVRASSFSGTSLPDDLTSTTFTTGTRLLPDEALAKPQGRASFLQRITGPGDGCGPVKFKGCIGLEEGGDIEMIARHGDDIILRMQLRELDGQFSFKVLPDCLEFRRRSRTGQRSEPLTICGDDLSTRDFRESDMDGYSLACHDGVFGKPEAEESSAASDDSEADDTQSAPEASAEGCSMTPVGSTHATVPLFTLLASLAITRIRRRR